MPRRLPARVPTAAFGLDAERLRKGDFSDRYFLNIQQTLTSLARSGYLFQGRVPPRRGLEGRARSLRVGEARVEMQFFTRRRPRSLACGIEHARAILETAAGGYDSRNRWVPAVPQAWAVPEGTWLLPLRPALRLSGRYRDFCILETPLLGVLARETRIATSVMEALRAARGKPVFFFPARMDLPATQPSDGWAYRIAVERYNRLTGRSLPLLISTEAQGERWGGHGAGTVAHGFVLCFLRDTAEAMLHYAEALPLHVRRIALVDTTGDCVGEALRTARAFFEKHLAALRSGNREQAERFRLEGVRADTAAEVRDRSVKPTGDIESDRGVNERLVSAIRLALDGAADLLPLRREEARLARAYFRNIRIVATGGFDPEKIARFERARAPVDIYGIGSWFLRSAPNDFTADVVRVELAGQWVEMAKKGRKRIPNRDLRRLL